MSCNGSINLGFVWISWFKSFWHALETLLCFACIAFVCFTPPCWVDNWIEWCWTRSGTISMLMRVVNLEASLWSVSRLGTLWAISPPRRWRLAYYKEVIRGLSWWSTRTYVLSKAGLSLSWSISSRILLLVWRNIWAWSSGINEFWIWIWVRGVLLWLLASFTCTFTQRLWLVFPSFFSVMSPLASLSRWPVGRRIMRVTMFRRNLERLLRVSSIKGLPFWILAMCTNGQILNVLNW